TLDPLPCAKESRLMCTLFLRHRAFAVLAAGLLAAGATAAQDVDPEQRLARYQRAAGEPVQGFRLFGALNHWEALGQAHGGGWAGPAEANLRGIDTHGPAVARARASGLGDRRGRVAVRSGSITAIGDVAGLPCRVQTIQPVDAEALRALDGQPSEGSGGT